MNTMKKNFGILARPFVKFMAYGKDTYALTPAGIR
ncbi:MAG: hypothetical protein CM1200mP16_15400 [Nitrospina sp.]|nr:MAG: hypothetical protein CM1200mP16_15400 [Nitrospina sp.]